MSEHSLILLNPFVGLEDATKVLLPLRNKYVRSGDTHHHVAGGRLKGNTTGSDERRGGRGCHDSQLLALLRRFALNSAALPRIQEGGPFSYARGCLWYILRKGL